MKELLFAALCVAPECAFLGFLAWHLLRESRASRLHRQRMENEYAAFVAELKNLSRKDGK